MASRKRPRESRELPFWECTPPRQPFLYDGSFYVDEYMRLFSQIFQKHFKDLSEAQKFFQKKLDKGKDLEIRGKHFPNSFVKVAMLSWNRERCGRDLNQNLDKYAASMSGDTLEQAQRVLKAFQECYLQLHADQVALEEQHDSAVRQYSSEKQVAEKVRNGEQAVEAKLEECENAKAHAMSLELKLSMQIRECEEKLEQLHRQHGEEAERVRMLMKREGDISIEQRAFECERQKSEEAVAKSKLSYDSLCEAKRVAKDSLMDVERKISDLTAAVAVRQQEHERELLTWTSQDVMVWVRSVEQGRFASYAPEFSAQAVTGQLLATATQEDLVALGVRDLGARRALQAAIRKLRAVAQSADPKPPDELVCPITQELMEDPVAVVGDEQGHGYERCAIEEWFAGGKHTVPATGVALPEPAGRQLLPLRALARQAREWRDEH